MELFPFDDDYLRKLVERDSETAAHFQEYFTAMLRLKLRRRVSSPDAIDEITEEVFTRVFEHLYDLKDARKLGAFVNAICSNVLREYYRASSDDAADARVGEKTEPESLIVIAWDPSVVTDEQYLRLHIAIDELARACGAGGLERIASDAVAIAVPVRATP